MERPQFIVATPQTMSASQMVSLSIYVGRPQSEVAASQRRSIDKMSALSHDGEWGGGCGTQWGGMEARMGRGTAAMSLWS